MVRQLEFTLMKELNERQLVLIYIHVHARLRNFYAASR
jgi:hypothetical protein